MSLKSQTLKICVSYHRVPQMPNWSVWTFSLSLINNWDISKALVKQYDKITVMVWVGYYGNTGQISLKLKVVSESHSNTMEVNDIMYLKKEYLQETWRKYKGKHW